MTAEQEVKTLFQQAGEIRQKIIEDVKAVETSEITISFSLAAVIIGFPGQFLKEAGILMAPEEDGVKIIVSKDRKEILSEAFTWANQDEKTQNRILVRLYKALLCIGQASVTPGVDVAQVLTSHESLIDASVENFPPLENLVEFLRGGGILTNPDQQSLSGVAYSIFQTLKVADDPRLQVLERQGLTPDKMFIGPD